MSASHPNYIISRMILRMGVDVPLVVISLIPTDVGLADPRLCPFLPPNPTQPTETCKATSYSSAMLNLAGRANVQKLSSILNQY